MAEFWSLTFAPLVIAILAALNAALIGNFLVLRRQVLLADAISHVVLPGIVGAFLVTGLVSPLFMVLGSLLAALASILMIEGLKRAFGIENGAAIGIVFTLLFAVGVLMLELSDASRVHLDVEHALFGNLESLVWLAAESAGALIDPARLAELPPALPRLAATLLILSAILIVFWRPLILASFDPVYATTRGVWVRGLSLMLSALMAFVAVASFEAVGSIIVIAMVICPPAAARLLTDHLGTQIALSLVFAVSAAALGTLFAGYFPQITGFSFGISAAGMVATLSGMMLAITASWVVLRRK